MSQGEVPGGRGLNLSRCCSEVSIWDGWLIFSSAECTWSEKLQGVANNGRTCPHSEELCRGSSPMPWKYGGESLILPMSLAEELTTELDFEGEGIL